MMCPSCPSNEQAVFRKLDRLLGNAAILDQLIELLGLAGVLAAASLKYGAVFAATKNRLATTSQQTLLGLSPAATPLSACGP